MKAFITTILTLLFFTATAQDSSAVNNTIHVFSVLELINNAPYWLTTAVIITGALLTATQTILSRFPTEKSVKIKGVIGKILDVLALFPPDNKKGGGTHFK
ncbi:MAG TPA: hypothetical protein PKK18_04090 [Chitinophagales bacterium]|nr:hypothetical protein [Chitinophagales bacterium]HMW12310.1 hypothetical protein [Chitinophagales bacterium]HMY22584.1 hypothetical protein [Chitinophagales bacterium]HMZ33432.1 hypothetical protein [Chitinophagales bacterium]HNA38719.1 hypothetical protein [Chitinophagales bacterium]